MPSRPVRLAAALAVVALAVVALAPAALPAQHAGHTGHAGHAGPGGAPPAGAAVRPPDPAAVARARADSARYPYTAADVAFMTTMIPHHAQALRMAAWAEARAGSPAVRTLAERIINAQRDEIATMQRWLGDRLQPVPVVHGMGEHVAMPAGAAGHEALHGAAAHAAHADSGHAAMAGLMPGMLTDAELQRLEAARGAEFDRLFLVSMIAHHRGAVQMVERLFSSYGAGQDEIVFKFASDVHVDQITEIARMEQMLLQLVLGDARAAGDRSSTHPGPPAW